MAEAPGGPDLEELYWRLAGEEGVELAEFVERARSGEWGPVPVDRLRQLVERVVEVVLANIGVKAEEGLFYHEQAEARRQEVQAEGARLLERLREPD